MRPSAWTGDAEKLPPRRSVQTFLPVRASTQEATPPSSTRKSRSSTRSGDGFEPTPLRSVQAMWLSLTSPSPSGRTARSLALPKPVLMKTRP